MARTVSLAAQTALAATITRPISLIEIELSITVRLSSYGSVTWNALAWTGSQRVSVSGLAADGGGKQSGRIEIGNEDLLFGALLLNQSAVDKPVKIWQGDAGALGDNDLTLVFDGVISSFQVSPESVVIDLTAQGARTLFSPRRFIGASAGFNALLPAGTVIRIGNQIYTLERA